MNHVLSNVRQHICHMITNLNRCSLNVFPSTDLEKWIRLIRKRIIQTRSVKWKNHFKSRRSGSREQVIHKSDVSLVKMQGNNLNSVYSSSKATVWLLKTWNLEHKLFISLLWSSTISCTFIILMSGQDILQKSII